ncbi:MAG: helix-turn-helix domain-containing protein [Verrucomicrobiae bacterium]|nr:helix-turn-helix domain-containing protein [Verrucomicrobiae bacterium]
MLDPPTRTTILKLHREGHAQRFIAQILGLARRTIQNVLRSGSEQPQPKPRAQKAEPYRERILDCSSAAGATRCGYTRSCKPREQRSPTRP